MLEYRSSLHLHGQQGHFFTRVCTGLDHCQRSFVSKKRELLFPALICLVLILSQFLHQQSCCSLPYLISRPTHAVAQIFTFICICICICFLSVFVFPLYLYFISRSMHAVAQLFTFICICICIFIILLAVQFNLYFYLYLYFHLYLMNRFTLTLALLFTLPLCVCNLIFPTALIYLVYFLTHPDLSRVFLHPW